MAENSKIEWTDHTWTPVVGCDAVSPACANCYAATMAARLEAMGQEKYRGVAVRVGGKGKWTGKVTFWEPDLFKPLKVKKPARWFLTSMGDVFHGAVPDGVLMRLLDVMVRSRQHTFYVLTKRADRARSFLERWADLTGEDGDPKVRGPAETRAAHPSGRGQLFAAMLDTMGKPPSGCAYPTFDWAGGMLWWRGTFPNILIGCTAENQERADELCPHMAAIAAAGWKTFVSYEPALGPVDWTGWEFLKLLISGGESGPRARPAHPDWHRGARDFAAAHGMPYMFKQWGEWVPAETDKPGDGECYAVADDGSDRQIEGRRTLMTMEQQEFIRVGKQWAGRLLDGAMHDGFPEVRA